jgi:hypothetical protein
MNVRIQLVINIAASKLSRDNDSHRRKATIKHEMPCIMTVAAARTAGGRAAVKALRDDHSDMR